MQAAKDAGAAILSVYGHALDIEIKGDGSPLTLADQMAHQIILARLADSNIPIVSEEGDDLHLDAKRYWLVDPLDGTKDFLAGNNEFTVNIALVVNQLPVLGVVYAPALDELYAGGQGLGVWMEKNSVRHRFTVTDKSIACRMAVSRFHDHPDVDIFFDTNHMGSRIAIGSALKYGQLATAKVDVFPRLVGSSEWDTAAGQAVLEAAGGHVLDWHTGKPLRYGKNKRRNPRLLAFRAPYVFTDFNLKNYPQELL